MYFRNNTCDLWHSSWNKTSPSFIVRVCSVIGPPENAVKFMMSSAQNNISRVCDVAWLTYNFLLSIIKSRITGTFVILTYLRLVTPYRSRSILVQAMAWSSHHLNQYWLLVNTEFLTHRNRLSRDFSNAKKQSIMKIYSKCRLQNVGHFIQASMC